MKHAWKELIYGKKKYILIELLLILLMFMVLFLVGLAEGLGRAVISGIDTMDAEYFLLDESAERQITVSGLKEDVLGEVRSMTSSDVTTLDIQRTYLTKGGDTEKINAMYFAIEPGSFIEPDVMEGNGLTVENAEHSILLDDDFKLKGIAVGDTVYDSSSDFAFTVVGFTKDQMYNHASVGFISTETYTEICTALNPMYQKSIHALVIRGRDVEKIKVAGTELVKKADVISSIPAYTAEQSTISMIVWVLIIVSAVIIGIFHYIMTLQKRKQFGVMKALGTKNRTLAGAVICEVGTLSVFAAIFSLGLTFGMAAAIPETMPFYLKFSDAAIVALAFVVISVLSSILSIVNISRIDPITAIGGGEE
jgi:putative ABC transport system permease protein